MMATLDSYLEEECYNVYWKVKNFSYCCGLVTSPVFSFSGQQFVLELNPSPSDVGCCMRRYDSAEYNLTMQISFLTCDGSPEESISGAAKVTLQVLKNVIFGNRRNSFLSEDTLTVRLRTMTESERGKVLIFSQIGVKRNCFLWTIKDFSKRTCNTEKTIENSPVFGIIILTLKSMGGIDSAEQLSLNISRTSYGDQCLCVLKVSILDVDGRGLNEVSDEFVFEYGKHARGFPSVIKKSKWIEYKNLLLSDDTLSLKCDFAISLGTVTDRNPEICYCENAAPLMKEYEELSMTYKETHDSVSVIELQADLKSILDNGNLFDVNLQIGSEIIQAHKIILSARSPVFMAMFTKDMQETIRSTVVIEDLDIDTVRRLLLYIYTNSINDDEWGNMRKLYCAADKYEVLSLKKKCSSFLKTNFSINNVCEALEVADLHQDEDLKTAAIDFISEHDSVVFVLEVWKELEKKKPYLALKCMREICLNKKN